MMLGGCGNPDANSAKTMVDTARTAIASLAAQEKPPAGDFKAMAELQKKGALHLQKSDILKSCKGQGSYSLSALPGKIAIHANCNGKAERGEWTNR